MLRQNRLHLLSEDHWIKSCQVAAEKVWQTTFCWDVAQNVMQAHKLLASTWRMLNTIPMKTI